MRPNMDEYEDVEDAKVGSSRAMSWAVLAVAVGGFAALAYYAYHSGNKATTEGDMMVVEADGAPIKEAPTSTDGEQFPNKDKTIYDVIAPNGTSPEGEKMLPEAEQPIAAMSIEDSEDSAPVAVPPAAAVPPVVAAAPKPAPSTTTFVAKEPAAEIAAPAVEEQVATKPVVEEKPALKAPEEKSASNTQIINEKKIVAKKPAPVAAKKESAKEVAKVPAKPKAEAASSEGGSYKVQLGAFKSEEEAQAAWAKISAKHASVLTGSPSIIKAELPNGTFYRLRTGSFDSKAAANAACASMSGQACMAVK